MKFWQWLSHRLPKKLAYFCVIRVVAYATSGQYGNELVPELKALDAIKRFGDTL